MSLHHQPVEALLTQAVIRLQEAQRLVDAAVDQSDYQQGSILANIGYAIQRAEKSLSDLEVTTP